MDLIIARFSLCESEKLEHLDLSLDFPLPIFSCIMLLLLSQSFSAKTKCKCEFPDYSSCGLVMSKLNNNNNIIIIVNQSVHAFMIRTVSKI